MPARERTCTAKNRVRELRSPGSVRDEGSNVLVYSDPYAVDPSLAIGDGQSGEVVLIERFVLISPLRIFHGGD